MARLNTDEPMGIITNDVGLYCTYASAYPQTNPNNLEPKDLPKSSNCWQKYYWALDQISAASGTNLDNLKSGDPNGNPYAIRTTEGRSETECSNALYIFTGHNADTAISTTLSPSLKISPYLARCQ